MSSTDMTSNTLLTSLNLNKGRFSLILALCNYESIKNTAIDKLKQSSVNIQHIEIPVNAASLFDIIKREVNEKSPDAVMLSGLEKVKLLEPVLIRANHIREEFRNHFSFPIILWVNGKVHSRFIHKAPDFTNWSRTVDFTPEDEELLSFFKKRIETIFNVIVHSETHSLTFTDEDEFLLSDLEEEELDLSDDEEADVSFINGLNEFHQGQIDKAIGYFERCVDVYNDEKLGALSLYLARCYQGKKDIDSAIEYLHRAIGIFTQSEQKSVTASVYLELGKLFLTSEKWDDLEKAAKQSLEIAQNNNIGGDVIAVSYRLLAEAACKRQNWNSAKEYAQKGAEAAAPHEQDAARLKLAEAMFNLGQKREAIELLEKAVSDRPYEQVPNLYAEIYAVLSGFYYDQKQYLKAFETKGARLSLEQQYGLRSFIGPGRVKARRLAYQETEIPPEIKDSGREADVEELKKILEHEYKFIIIHGQSGVGKSSIIEAGFMPYLQGEICEDGKSVLPILVNKSYTDWISQVRRGLEESGPGNEHVSDGKADFQSIFNKIRHLTEENLIVLVFDQFEEFFFANPDLSSRKSFYEFLRYCLSSETQFVKVVLSMRQDYIHYLLEFEQIVSSPESRRQEFTVDLLEKRKRHFIGNLKVEQAKVLFKKLAPDFEEELIDAIVHDLTEEQGDIRPIELQILGSQLQEEKITSRSAYRPRQELIEKFLVDVVHDCGGEHKDAAWMLLYNLTGEHIIRPLKTEKELVRDLSELDISLAEKDLELILKILTGSRLVTEIPDKPARYQLVHDYLAELLRKGKAVETKRELEEKKQERLRQEKYQEELEEKERQLEEERLRNELEKEKAAIQSAYQKQKGQKKLIKLSAAAVVVFAALAFVAAWFGFEARKATARAEKQAKIAEMNSIEALNHLSYSIFTSSKDNIQDAKALITGIRAGIKARQKDVPEESKRIVNLVTYNLQAVLNDSLLEKRFEDKHSSVTSVSFSPDGKTLASGSYDKTVKLWNVESDKELKTLSGYSYSVRSVSFSPDSKTLAASGSYDKTVKLWDVESGKELKTLSGHFSDVWSVNFSPDGKTLASGSSDNTVKLWDMESGKELKTLSGHSSYVTSVSFSPDGKTLASGSYDKTVKLWDLESGKELKTLSGHFSHVWSVSFSPDGKTLASGSSDNTVKLWDMESGKELKTLSGHFESVWSVSFSPDGKTLASGSSDNTVKLWDLESGKELKTLRGHSDDVRSVSFSPDGKTLASGSSDRTVKLWDLESSKELKTLSGHSDSVKSVSFSPDGKTLASGSSDNTVKLWDLESGKELKTLSGHSDSVWSVSFSPDGKTLASGSSDNTVKLWDLESDKELKTLSGHSDSVESVSFSPDGKTLASGSYDKTVKLWDLESGKELKTLSGHFSHVWSVSFSPDGKTIASGSHDKTVKLWDVESGKELKTLSGHSDSVESVSFSPDGKTLASGSYDKTVKLWNFDLDKLLKNGCEQIEWYLKHSPDVSDEDRTLCDDVR
jgi:WD40 repeat protein